MTRSATACQNPRCSCDPCSCAECHCSVPKLSSLERRVMDCAWQSGGDEVTVRDVAAALPEYAYTTVATVLDRLALKGVLRCRLVKHAKRYTPIGSRGAHTAVLMYDALLADADPDAALHRFAEGLSDSQAALLRRALQRQ